MKTLEELGISPAPWTVGVCFPYTISDDNGDCVVDFCRKHDARLMSAAPELYYALRMVYLQTKDISDCTADDRDGCWRKAARAALEKAGGDVSNQPDGAKGDVQ